MVSKGLIRKGEYFDSVTLMLAGRELSGLEGVIDAAVVMGTRENRAILENSGLLLEEFKDARDSDLLVAVKADSEKIAFDAFDQLDRVFAESKKRTGEESEYRPASIDGALEIMPGANIAIVSVAGAYAGDVAMSALDRGLHVMIFSDNVPLDTEIALKKTASEKGLFVLGPDCGTAIINGVPLGFANSVKRGGIGLVAASGTGLQEVSCITTSLGAGISQALGTGGRDVSDAVGGVSFLEGIRALEEDPATKVIVLVSKPPGGKVLRSVAALLEKVRKPVVAILLGAEDGLAIDGVFNAGTLEEAAFAAAFLAGDPDMDGLGEKVRAALASRNEAYMGMVDDVVKKLRPGKKFIRGLFSGGTFCTEAQLIIEKAGVAPINSNAPSGKSQPLEDNLASVGHTLIDMGADEFTVGRPHPMIDFSLRRRRIIEEIRNPETAVILLDVVLGFGSNMDPAGELEGTIPMAIAAGVPVIVSVTGTPADPQGVNRVASRLVNAGAAVLPSNASAARLAGALALAVEKKMSHEQATTRRQDEGE